METKNRPTEEFLGEDSIRFLDFMKNDDNGWTGHPVMFDGITFGFCTSGDMEFKINYREFKISAHEMFVCLPKQLFTVETCSDDIEIKMLTVRKEFLSSLPVSFGFEWLKAIDSCPCISPGRQKADDITAIYMIMRRYATEEKYTAMTCKALLLSLTLMMTSVIDSSSRERESYIMSRQEKVTRNFFELMSEHYKEERSVSFYADKLCLSPKHLTTVVKSVTGQSLQEWLNEVILAEAKHCLMSPDTSVLQLSEILHFSTASSFVRFFRQHTGETPLEYRKRQQKLTKHAS